MPIHKWLLSEYINAFFVIQYVCVFVSVPCSKPMDVLFLLRASSDNQFEDLKTFVRTIIKSTNIGKSL